MQLILVKRAVCSALAAGVAVTLTACGGGGSGSSAVSTSGTTTPPAQTGSVPLMVSDASSDDWATIGVKILSIALVPGDLAS